MRSSWTDERLDEFKASVEARFDDLNRRVSELSARVDSLQHAMINGFIAMMATMLTGFIGLAGLILTQM